MRYDFWRLLARGQQAAPTAASGDPGPVDTTSTSSSAVTGKATAAPSAAPVADAIDFQDSTNFDGDERVLLIEYNQGTGGKAFTWDVAESVGVHTVSWVGQDSDSGSYKNISVAEYSSKSKTFTGSAPFVSVQDNEALLDIMAFADHEFEHFRMHPMFIQVDWENSAESGSSRSGVFAIASTVKDSQSSRDALQNALVKSSAASGTQIINSTTPTATAAIAPSQSSGASGPVTTTTSTVSSDEASGGGGGGLSTGAIAGIAVGAGLVFIALVAGLVWFMLRRRREKKLGYSPEETSNTLMMEKDISQNHIAEASRDPYSDGGNHVHESAVLHSPARDDDDSHHNGASFAPYDDSAPVRDTSPSGANPHDVSRSVAHLVEDGMTQDEIRRLEEEERQLDDEIERAGRR